MSDPVSAKGQKDKLPRAKTHVNARAHGMGGPKPASSALRPNFAAYPGDDSHVSKMSDVTSNEMELYRIRVELLRVRGSDEVILNGSHEHAAVLIENLFLAAKTEVHALVRCLNPDVYGSDAVLEAAREFLKRDGAHISILVQDAEALDEACLTSNAFLAEFYAHDRVEIRVAPPHSAPFNFVVVDTDGFRFEPDATKPVARASFNGPDVAGMLREYFELLDRDMPDYAA